MKRFLFALLITFSCSFSLISQNAKITGSVSDTLGVGLVNANVLLLEEDSTMLEFTQSDLDGNFILEKIPYGKYLLKITYIGYFPATFPIEINKPEIKVEQVQLNEVATALMEVVVKAAKAPLKMRGDTVEYDISQFKVPQNSTLEELLRQLPGMQVDQSGGLKSDGVDITTVKVDGKNFFGNNPTMATKNLPAEAVGAVQVYDRKTDEQVATGNTTPTNEKEMNVVLKDDFKNIMFGKGTVGAGNLDRMEGKFSINKFSPLHQFSILGVGNNTGRNGIGWDDREDFFGAQAYNMGNMLKYGFNSLGNVIMISMSSENDLNLEGKISGLFSSSGNSGGLPKNGTAGLNYNYEGEKVQAGGRYVFNHRGNDLNRLSTINRLLPGNVTNQDRTFTNTVTGGTVNRIEGAFTGKIDSFNTVKAYLDFGNIISNNDVMTSGTSFSNENLISTSTIINDRRESGLIGSGTLVYNKTFRKTGRFFGLNSTYTRSTLGEDIINNSDLIFTQEPDQLINQDFNNDYNKRQLQANATYSEPINKYFFAGVFHNFDQTVQTGDIKVNDLVDNTEIVNKELTRSYETEVLYNFSGTSLRYSNEGLNLTMGVGYQFTDLFGNFTGLNNNDGKVDTTFRNPAYMASLSYRFTRTTYSGLSYSRTIVTPGIGQLTPVRNNQNPLYIREGNPMLQPEISSSYSMSFSTSKPLTGLRFSGQVYATVKQNAITQEEEVSENLITTTRPINYKDSRNVNLYSSVSIPILANKINFGFNANIGTNASYRLVNDVENKTNTINYRPGLNLNITPSEIFSLYLTSGLTVSNTKYSINTTQNQSIINQNHRATLSLKVANSLYFNGNYTHQIINNKSFGERTSIPIINASLNKQFLPGNKGEIRLALYDVLNKNQIYSNVASSNTVSESSTVALARYFMVSFSYNIKGMKTGISSVTNY